LAVVRLADLFFALVLDFAADPRRERELFFTVAGRFSAGTAPVETRDECFGRWRTLFRCAASAAEVSARTATRETSTIRIDLRVIKTPRSGPSPRSDYLSATQAGSRWFPYIL
jgi:hypothetical protein